MTVEFDSKTIESERRNLMRATRALYESGGRRIKYDHHVVIASGKDDLTLRVYYQITGGNARPGTATIRFINGAI